MEQGEQTGIRKILNYAISKNSSDIHIKVGVPPIVRVDGRLKPVENEEVLDVEKCELYIKNLLNAEQYKRLQRDKELDFSFSFDGTRFRTNIYYDRSNVNASLRLISQEIKTFNDLGLPPILERFTLSSQGLVIVTGPTGHGKSTTMASMIDYINTNRSSHIITIEDPIEYTFKHKKSIISQREVGNDTKSFSTALRSSFREDPDVIMVGEMRDLETIEAALTLAETGHLVLTTLHTNSSSQTADRIIDVFPPHQQAQVRSQLASVIIGVVSQRLIPKINGGRIVACEIMMVTNAVRSVIRDGKTHQLNNIIQTSASDGMISLDKVLAEYVNKGDITLDDALMWAMDQKAFKMMIY
jgi:twitching motility protein PilT